MQVQPPPRATPSPLTGEYVYFDRSTAGMRKVKLEHFYQKAVGEAIERNGRRQELEKRLAADPTQTPETRSRALAQFGRHESSFLRLRRTRLWLDDFTTVKVIGKGAFGEV